MEEPEVSAQDEFQKIQNILFSTTLENDITYDEENDIITNLHSTLQDILNVDPDQNIIPESEENNEQSVDKVVHFRNILPEGEDESDHIEKSGDKGEDESENHVEKSVEKSEGSTSGRKRKPEETKRVQPSRTKKPRIDQNQGLIKNHITPIPKDCIKNDCNHEILFGRHFIRRETTKLYNGICPECGIAPQPESKRSKISKGSLMKTHLFYQCEIYKFGQKYPSL